MSDENESVRESGLIIAELQRGWKALWRALSNGAANGQGRPTSVCESREVVAIQWESVKCVGRVRHPSYSKVSPTGVSVTNSVARSLPSGLRASFDVTIGFQVQATRGD